MGRCGFVLYLNQRYPTRNQRNWYGATHVAAVVPCVMMSMHEVICDQDCWEEIRSHERKEQIIQQLSPFSQDFVSSSAPPSPLPFSFVEISKLAFLLGVVVVGDKERMSSYAKFVLTASGSLMGPVEVGSLVVHFFSRLCLFCGSYSC